MNFNPADLMKQLNNLQSSMKEMQSKLDTIEVTGTAGGGLVSVTLNGKMEMTNIILSPECVDNREIIMLQDIIKAAHKDAMNKIKDKLQNEMGTIPGMPGGFPQ
ncbi:YbaB/EbfC family nucleoid-associated protein [Spirochaeta cellobiosiphila]|uniref:YbaB/EbfC family nucleoid-associated protein n=1 Tax=Spirochaeta cellobiosiphila TaxID=504483 RepID=UPI000410A4D1|nr:YbaB/EbfC family nucleoid-associated protein [Spirochaeta cellobiosiphila]